MNMKRPSDHDLLNLNETQARRIADDPELAVWALLRLQALARREEAEEAETAEAAPAPDPSTPSAMIAPYAKPNAVKKSKKRGRAAGHAGSRRAARWHIRDFGRGIGIEHFTLNENREKLGTDGVIGKFGVGLKDALATLDRHRAIVVIHSRHGTFTLTKAAKHNFNGISTLHIAHDPADLSMCGTDVVLAGIYMCA